MIKMNNLDAISELKYIIEKSEVFKLDVYDRAHIDDIIKHLEELDKIMISLFKLTGGLI